MHVCVICMCWAVVGERWCVRYMSWIIELLFPASTELNLLEENNRLPHY